MKYLNDLPIGALVKDTNTRSYGSPIIFRIVDKNHDGYPDNSCTLLSENTLRTLVFDWNEPTNPHGVSGSQSYALSNIRQWMNSNDAAWYQPTCDYDTPPSSTEPYPCSNYVNEPGFLTNFSEAMQDALMLTNIPVQSDKPYGGRLPTYSASGLHPKTTDDTLVSYVTDYVFLLSKAEVNMDCFCTPEGNRLAWFATEPSSIFVEPTTSSKRYGAFTAQAYIDRGDPPFYPSPLVTYACWLRTPFECASDDIISITTSFGEGASGNNATGFRPAINIPLDTQGRTLRIATGRTF